MHFILRFLAVCFLLVIYSYLALGQVTYLDLPERDLIENQLPSYRDFRRAEIARANSVNRVNNLVAPTVINPTTVVCTREPIILNVVVISNTGRSIAFLPTATSSWQLISRTGNVFIRVSADTTFYVAELNATLDTIGPRVPVSLVYQDPPSPLGTPLEFVLCPGVENRLDFNNPEGLPVTFDGAFSASTNGNFIIIPENASGLVFITKRGGNGIGCSQGTIMNIVPAIPTPTIAPSNILFCQQPNDVLFSSVSTLRYNIYRRESDLNPILSIEPGQVVPASVFVGTDSSFYIAAITRLQCAGVKQLVTYSTLSDTAKAGNNVESCVGIPVALNATAPKSGQTGQWRANQNVTFSNRNIPTSNVTANRNGVYELVWVISSPQCGEKTDNLTFTVSGYTPIQVATSILACDQIVPIPYLADPRVEVGVYRNANGTNPVVIVNSGQAIIITQPEMDATYYIGYTNAECRTPLKEVTIARSETPNINFSENYLVCQRTNTNIVIRNPIVNDALQPLKIGTFSTNTSGINLDWNSTGAFLTVSGLRLNNIYTIRYEYTFGNCAPVLGSFVINTNGSPPAPVSPLNLVSCGRNYVLRIPNAPLGYSVYLDRIGSGASFTSDSNQFLLTLIDPVTSFNYGFYSAECGKGAFQRINIRLETPFKNLVKLPDLSINIGKSVALSNDGNQPGFSYQWSNSINNEVLTSLNATARPDRTTTYYLQINSPDNCIYSDTILVFVNSDFEMPNMFTPNGNGFNEAFGVPEKANVQTPYELTIVNKYGQVVFNKSGPSVRWNGDLSNGNPAPQDTYYYRIRFSEGFENKNGTVQLVR